VDGILLTLLLLFVYACEIGLTTWSDQSTLDILFLHRSLQFISRQWWEWLCSLLVMYCNYIRRVL